MRTPYNLFISFLFMYIHTHYYVLRFKSTRRGCLDETRPTATRERLSQTCQQFLLILLHKSAVVGNPSNFARNAEIQNTDNTKSSTLSPAHSQVTTVASASGSSVAASQKGATDSMKSQSLSKEQSLHHSNVSEAGAKNSQIQEENDSDCEYREPMLASL